MATLDDKLLGEKSHYYCSSSSDEEDESVREEKGGERGETSLPSQADPPDQWPGYSTNTGPKGVIHDFQRCKQMEAGKRLQEEQRALALAKQLSLSCQTSQEAAEAQLRDQQLEAELEDLIDQADPVLQEYMRKRMQEMTQKLQPSVSFGHLIRCTDGTQFLREIEEDVRTICHIYSIRVKECQRLTDCFEELARRHPTAKFVAIEVNACGMSERFQEKGCPAILVYSKGSLIGSFVAVTDQLGCRFDADDVESFLTDHGFLSDRTCVPEIVSANPRFRDAVQPEDEDSE